ncbi:MAG TPA: DUF6600 domain-containing protein [Candidatus Sulfotelmatobacter sp.]|jgi:hypothetical protein|nr:DUF6600 domain-containing protein [Candidatus Sulfotelmatobacter sp.]
MFIKRDVKRMISFCLLIALASYALPAMADDDDPPSRVARLAYAQGAVSFQPAGTDDWVTAGVNRPATTGDKLWSDHDGRVELQLDGSMIRLSNNTGFSFLNLSNSVTQIQLSAGTLLVRVRRLDDNETYEIDTPNLAFSVLRPGLYKISVNDAGDSTAIKIRSGAGEVTGGGAAYTVHANDSATFSGFDRLNANSENYGNEEDQFDNWAATRDRRSEHSNSARYVSADVVGYEDLDDHGSWRQTPDNGNVWFPRTSVPGWAPYHYGHWDYIEPWGYTWVDDEPWGFAPFHYGRWVSYEGSWGWVPARPQTEGEAYVRPVYAPALVAWVGGPHFAIGVGAGSGEYASGESVGWFPLGPREVYVPSYRVSRNYVNNVNVSNTTVNSTVVNNYYNTTVVNNNVNVTNVKYVNQSVPGAVAATTPHAFTGAQSVNKNSVKVDQREVASAPVRAFTPSAAPAKQAVLGTGTAAVKPPAAIQTRAVVAKVAPPPPPPTFEKRQEAIKGNGGKPLSTAQVQQIAPATAHREAPVNIAPAAKAVAAPVPGANRPGQPQAAQPQPGQPAQVAPNAGNKAAPLPTQPANHMTERPANLRETPEPVQTNRPPVANKPPQTAPPQTVQPGNPPAARPGDRPGNPNSAPEPVQTNRPPAANKSPQTPAPETVQPNNPPANHPGDRPANPRSTPEPVQTIRPPAANNPPPPPDRHTDRPAPTNDANPNANKPGTPDSQPSNRPLNDRPADRPVNPNASSQPPQPNRTAPPAVHPNEIPTPARPVVQSTPNSELDRKHQQEQDQLHANQQQDRQRVQQQQEQEHAKLSQQQADAAKKQQVEQQHQTQTQQLQEKHTQEQKQLQEKQQQERQNQPKPQKKESPPPSDKP